MATPTPQTLRRIHVYSTERLNEILRRVRIWSDTLRPKNKGSGHVVRVGVATATSIDYLGQWDQHSTTLQPRVPLEMLGVEALNRPLREGEVCVIEVGQYGVPEQLSDGISIEWKFGRVGATGGNSGRRMDQSGYEEPRAITSPLFELGKHMQDRDVREGIEPVVDALNTSGVTEWVLTMQLSDPVNLEETPEDEGEVYSAGPVNVNTPAPAVTPLATLTLNVPNSSRGYILQFNVGTTMETGGAGSDLGGIAAYVNGTQEMPPTSPATHFCGTSGVTPTEYIPLSMGDCRVRIPVGTSTVTIILAAAYLGGASGFVVFHNSFINARLVPNPYVVP